MSTTTAPTNSNYQQLTKPLEYSYLIMRTTRHFNWLQNRLNNHLFYIHYLMLHCVGKDIYPLTI